MKYLVLMIGSAKGCDYTIGCGLNYEIIEAEDMEDAESQAWSIFENYGDSLDFDEYNYDEVKGTQIERAIIVEMSNTIELNISELIKKAWEKRKNETMESDEYKQFKEAKEKYDKLKDKFEDMENK